MKASYISLHVILTPLMFRLRGSIDFDVKDIITFHRHTFHWKALTTPVHLRTKFLNIFLQTAVSWNRFLHKLRFFRNCINSVSIRQSTRNKNRMKVVVWWSNTLRISLPQGKKYNVALAKTSIITFQATQP